MPRQFFVTCTQVQNQRMFARAMATLLGLTNSRNDKLVTLKVSFEQLCIQPDRMNYNFVIPLLQAMINQIDTNIN